MEQQFKTVITANSKWINLHLKETYEYRDLIFLFVRRDFVSKYKQTILGPLWAVIQPLLTTIVFTVIFRFTGKPDYAGCESDRRNRNSGISVLYGRYDLLELFFIDGQQYGKHIYNKQFYYGKGIFSKAGISGSVNHI